MPIPWRYLFALLCIAMLYTFASTLDYYYERAVEAERITVLKDSYMKALVDCINGDVRFQWGDELFSGRCEPLGKAEI